MGMVIVVHGAGIFHIHRMEVGGAVERRRRVRRVHGAGRRGAVVEFRDDTLSSSLRLRRVHSRRRRAGHLGLVVEDALAEHVVLLLGHWRRDAARTSPRRVATRATVLARSVTVLVVPIFRSASHQSILVTIKHRRPARSTEENPVKRGGNRQILVGKEISKIKRDKKTYPEA